MRTQNESRKSNHAGSKFKSPKAQRDARSSAHSPKAQRDARSSAHSPKSFLKMIVCLIQFHTYLVFQLSIIKLFFLIFVKNLIKQKLYFNKYYKPLIETNMTKSFNEAGLPKNYAQLLLNCEIEVELNQKVSKQIIMEILQLYSKGMEYYESIHSYKYMYFERKMNAVMRSPKIIKSMTVNNTEQIKKDNEKPSTLLKINQDDRIKIMQVKHKYDKMYNDLIGQTSALTGDKIKRIVAENQVKLNEVKETINNQISEQQTRLQLKIQRRKFQSASKKTCMSSSKMEKSTRDSLFSDHENVKGQSHLDVDFTKVINQFETDLDQGKMDVKQLTYQTSKRLIQLIKNDSKKSKSRSPSRNSPNKQQNI